MKKVRMMVAVLAAATLAGCDGAASVSPKTMTPGGIARQAVVGDVVYLYIRGDRPLAGTVFRVKSYTALAEPFTCTANETLYTFVGQVTVVAPGYTTGPGTMGGTQVFETSMELVPNTKLRVDSPADASCAGAWVQATVVQ